MTRMQESECMSSVSIFVMIVYPKPDIHKSILLMFYKQSAYSFVSYFTYQCRKRNANPEIFPDGSFTIDMVSATGDPGDFPGDTSQTRNATEIGSPQRDHDYADVLHALAMCGTFVILFPLGATVLRIFENVRFHWIIQALGVLVVIVGAGIGVNLSGSYNHVRTTNAWNSQILLGLN